MALFGFGIPDMKMKSDKTLPLEGHLEWIKQRRKQEEEGVEHVLVPQRFDVLFGRGKRIPTHTGNLRAGHLVEMHREEYEAVGRVEKTRIAEKIVQMVKESNGRFLKQDGCGWLEVSDEAARDKVSHFFRRLRSVATSKGDKTASAKSKKSRVRSGPDKETMDGPDSDQQKRRKGMES